MFDTISGRRSSIALSDFSLRHIGFEGSGKHYHLNFEINPSCKIALDFHNHFGKVFITSRFSLPKLLYGNNVKVIESDDELLRGLDVASGFISDVLGFDYDTRTMTINRRTFSN